MSIRTYNLNLKAILIRCRFSSIVGVLKSLFPPKTSHVPDFRFIRSSNLHAVGKNGLVIYSIYQTRKEARRQHFSHILHTSVRARSQGRVSHFRFLSFRALRSRCSRCLAMVASVFVGGGGAHLFVHVGMTRDK